MAEKLRVWFKDNCTDARGDYVKDKIDSYFGIDVGSVKKINVYTIDAALSEEEFGRVQKELFTDTIVQESSYSAIPYAFDFLVEVGYLPGVMDTVGRTAKNAIGDLLGKPLAKGENVYYSTQYAITGNISGEQINRISSGLLSNEMIQHAKIYTKGQKEETSVPKVSIPTKPEAKEVKLDIGDDELAQLSRNRSLALSLPDMKVIQEYYSREEVKKQRGEIGLPENPTDVELELIAQTQSEHCKHRIFNALITYRENGKEEIIDSLFKTYIQNPSKEIEKTKGWIVSTFWDNSGVVKFNDSWNYCVKCETHNSPSAVDPYGGAITGIVGVYRDPMGTGKGSKIIAGAYGYCTASPFYGGGLQPRMHPRRLLEGVIEGVKDGGNKSGVPTVYGHAFFDEGWIGKPLVYVAALGFMPKEVAGEPSHTKELNPGDLTVMVGGKVGKDGIHGATESSLEHGGWITAGHVQIGDPFTQKKVQDFILETRDAGLYKCITDNGAGGLSSSVGETAEFSNGCELWLEKVPLKYEGLMPWEILVSESQERMTIAVPEKNLDAMRKLAEKHDVELTVVGKYTDSGKFFVKYDGKPVALMDMDFLHGGFPRYEMEAEWEPQGEDEPVLEEVEDHNGLLKRILQRENIASKEFIQRQYDHEVQGGSALKMFIGKGDDGRGDAAVICPLLGSTEGIAIAAGFNPKYSKIDAYHMSACTLDESIRRCISVGAPLDKLCLNDNFCWPSTVYDAEKNPDGKLKLAQLVRANKALAECCLTFGTPCVSGKDSMFIDGNLKSSNGKTYKISGLPAVQYTATSKIEDVTKCVSMYAKDAGDLVYLVGETKDELGASEYYEMNGFVGKNVPVLDREKALKNYRAVESAISKGLVKSCHGCYKGGLGVALAEKSFGGRRGMRIDITALGLERDDKTLYSESAARFVLTVAPENKEGVEEIFNNCHFFKLGEVTGTGKLEIAGKQGKIIDVEVNELKHAWQETFRRF